MPTTSLGTHRHAALRAAIAGATVLGLACIASAPPAAASAPPSQALEQPLPASVVPVPGDRFAPSGTSITFRGAPESSLRQLTVVGSSSGRHSGKLEPLPGGGSVFVPSRPFAAGEQVTVEAPGLRIAGGTGDEYSFGTARQAAPAAARAALRLAAATDDPAPSPASRTSGPSLRPDQPANCPTVSYKSAPTIHAPGVCMNLGVTTEGTESGTYLFMTPTDNGAGIWTDKGELLWWQGSSGKQSLNESVVQFHGQPYLADWTGAASTFGIGSVTLYNEHYQVVGEVTTAGGFPADDVDLHEFQVTPSGDALFGIYDPVTVTIGSSSVTVLQYVVQEVSLVQDATGIHTGQLLFEWDSLSDVPTSASHTPNPGNGQAWDYFHGNAITQDSDGNLVVSARNTWGLYKIDDTPGDGDFGHVIWQVGAMGDPQLALPWCYQHDVAALGDDRYSLFDDGGIGPGCLPGTTEHPARALIVTIDPSTTPVGLTLDASYTHNPPINTGYTGSAQLLPNGDVLVDWADVPEITEFGSAGNVKMDLSLSEASYRGLRFAWVGQPLVPPSIAVIAGDGKTSLWASWNGATQVASWQLVVGTSASSMERLGSPVQKTSFETALSAPSEYPVVGVEALSSTGAVLGTSNLFEASGYLIAHSGGTVSGYGDAAALGSAAPSGLSSQVVGMAETPDGRGHWLVSSTGAVYAFGEARYYGSAAGIHLAAPMVGMAALPDGEGYWLVANDGGVFTYGDAKFHGSPAGSHLNQPIVALVPTPDGGGYWAIAKDGGVFTYGDAKYYGSAAPYHPNAPIVGAIATADGRGYWLVSSDGGVFTFGDARFHGSAGGAALSSPVTAVAETVDGDGYWLVTASGTVFAYGDALAYASPAGEAASGPTVAMAGSHATISA
jgi:hypothetical protein